MLYIFYHNKKMAKKNHIAFDFGKNDTILFGRKFPFSKITQDNI